MRAPSKRVVRRPRRMPAAGALVLGVLAVAALYPLVRHPLACLGVLAIMAAYVAVLTLIAETPSAREQEQRRARHLWQLSDVRGKSESICQFARSFEVRRTDTWVLRAVYEELLNHMSVNGFGPAFPVHADDAIVEDLLIDPDDCDEEIVPDIAWRARRSMDGLERNPVSSIVTVRDLVSFFVHQPRLEEAD